MTWLWIILAFVVGFAAGIGCILLALRGDYE